MPSSLVASLQEEGEVKPKESVKTLKLNTSQSAMRSEKLSGVHAPVSAMEDLSALSACDVECCQWMRSPQKKRVVRRWLRRETSQRSRAARRPLEAAPDRRNLAPWLDPLLFFVSLICQIQIHLHLHLHFHLYLSLYLTGIHTCTDLRGAQVHARLGGVTRGESWLSMTMNVDVE